MQNSKSKQKYDQTQRIGSGDSGEQPDEPTQDKHTASVEQYKVNTILKATTEGCSVVPYQNVDLTEDDSVTHTKTRARDAPLIAGLLSDGPCGGPSAAISDHNRWLDADDIAAAQASEYSESLTDETIVSRLICPSAPDRDVVDLSVISDWIISGLTIHWSTRWLRIPGTHRYFMDEDTGAPLWQITLRCDDAVFESKADGYCFAELATNSAARDRFRGMSVPIKFGDFRRSPQFLAALREGAINFDMGITVDDLIHVDGAGPLTITDLLAGEYDDLIIGGSNATLGLKSPGGRLRARDTMRVRNVRKINDVLNRTFTLLSGITLLSILNYFWRRPPSSCHLLIKEDGLFNPTLEEFLEADCSKVCKRRISIMYSPTQLHVVLDPNGRLPIDVLHELKQHRLTYGHTVVKLSPKIRIGKLIPTVVFFAAMSILIPVSMVSRLVRRESKYCAVNLLMYSLFTTWMRSFEPPEGRCYSIMTDEDHDAYPNLTKFAKEVSQVNDVRVRVTMGHNVVHVVSDDAGMLACDVIKAFRAGWVPIHTGWVEYDKATVIGGFVPRPAFIPHGVELVQSKAVAVVDYGYTCEEPSSPLPYNAIIMVLFFLSMYKIFPTMSIPKYRPIWMGVSILWCLYQVNQAACVTYLLFSMCCCALVFYSGASSDPVFVRTTVMGTPGDVKSLEMYRRLMTKMGISATINHTTPGCLSRSMMAGLESNSHTIPIMAWLIHALSVVIDCHGNDYVIANMVPSWFSNITTVGSSAPADSIRCFNLFNKGREDATFDLANQFTGAVYRMCPPTIQLGTRSNLPPRSADGVKPLQPQKNRGGRKTLVCLGSSLLREPPGLDPATTWSTRTDSVYQHEPRTDHAAMMIDYQLVICHGGAGTVATARSCGCEVKTMHEFLDRGYVPSGQDEFHANTDLFFLRWFETLRPSDQSRLFRVFWPNLSLRSRLELFLLMADGIMYFQLSLVSIISYMAVSIDLTALLADQDVSRGILPLFRGALISTGFAVMSSYLLASFCQMYGYKRLAMWGLENGRAASKYVVDVASYRTAFSFLLLSHYLGFVFASVASFIAFPMFMKIVCFMISIPLSSFVEYTTWLDRNARRELGDDGVYAVWQGMHNGVWPELLPMYHTEVLNSSTMEVTGTTICEMTGSCKSYVRPYQRSGNDFYIRLGDLSLWREIVAHTMERDGGMYSMFHNCQSTTFHVLGCLRKKKLVSTQVAVNIMLFLICCLITTTIMMLTVGPMVGLCMILSLGTGLELFTRWTNSLMPMVVYASPVSLSTKTLDRWVTTARSLINYLVDGAEVVTNFNDYPITPKGFCELYPHSVRVMRVIIGGKGYDYMPPLMGTNRTVYTRHRGNDYRNLHNIDDEGLCTSITQSDKEAILKLNVLFQNLGLDSGVVAVIATSPERPISQRVLAWAQQHCSSTVIITNEVGGFDNELFLEGVSGRTLGALRLALASTEHTFVSLNAIYDDMAWNGMTKLARLIPLATKTGKCITVSAHGINPGPAGLCLYSKPVIGDAAMELDIYGSDEVAISRADGISFVEDNMFMFNTVRKDMRIDCRRRLVLYNPVTLEDRSEINLDVWSTESLITALATAQRPRRRTLGLDESGVTINGTPVQMAPVISAMYPSGAPIEDVMNDVGINFGAFCRRISVTATEIVKQARTVPVLRETLQCFYKVTSSFAREPRSPKAVWAPVHQQLKTLRSEELGMSLHPNPVFVRADFDDTMAHYIKHLNFEKKGEHLSPTEFRRRVNRSPYVDTWLQKKLANPYETGIDASTLACKEVMLESLARYNKGGFVDAMTDQDMTSIVDAIHKRNPSMLSDAHIADPFKLTRKFLSYKRYSAGLPFVYTGSGISKRSDLRKNGWLKPIAELGSLPYRTGKWYPAIAHAFPKSQVVSRQKIWDKPDKMRSIVATAGFNNVQQNILNLDVNNRHDFTGTNEKVAMPLLGSYMNYVFSDIDQYDYVYSMDVTAMDANLPESVLKVVAELRKRGFEHHPLHEVISKHIDCAMEQTKHSYVINLISDLARNMNVDGEEEIVEHIKGWADGKGEWAISSDMAPGGVLKKSSGGSTGDANVTFNNTKGLAVIVMYCYCKATGVSYENFFDEVSLHNFGDDDVLGTNTPPEIMANIVKIAKKDLGLEMRFESKGTDIYSQVFLGRKPLPASMYEDEFRAAGIPTPKYAIINDTATMEMRLSREKAEMTRHKGQRHEVYRLEKAMGYALLCAHQKPLYDTIAAYFDEVKSRLPTEIVSQEWFKKKYKLIPYNEVLKKWYKPMTPDDFDGVHGLQMQVHVASETEAGFMRICSALNMICDAFPSHLVSADSSANAYRTSELYSGIFEAHAWHNYVIDHGEPPTLAELESVVSQGPYNQFTNCAYWMRTVGATLPTKGPLFERNCAHATWKVVIYTGVYVQTNMWAQSLNHLPFGNVIVEAINLSIFKSRKLFGSLSYANYVMTAKGSPAIDGLVPKDPYAYHKRFAVLAMQAMPDMGVLGYIPIHLLRDWVTGVLNLIATTNNTNMVSYDGMGSNHDHSPWQAAVENAKVVLEGGGVPLMVAHTGTGKTRYLPSLVLNDPDIAATQVIVCMPRNIICEQWSATSGALFKKRGVSGQSSMMTCTYGYLAHCHANNAIWWDPGAVFIFDEAHEESMEWLYLRKVFIHNHTSIALTATPSAQTVTSFVTVEVDVKPRYNIAEFTSDSLESAINKFAPSSTRMLIIEPSLKKCRKISERLTATGYQNKVVHSNDRDIPEGIHIVATSVIEASITIPGCDLVLDTGERLVNDGGELKRVPNDIPGSIQRKGRTGRTNDGTYVLLKRPVNKIYKPVPDVLSLVSDSKVASIAKTTVRLDRNPTGKKLLLDNFGFITGVTPQDITAASMIHLLRHGGIRFNEMATVYEKLRAGRLVPVLEHILVSMDLDTQRLPPFRVAFDEYVKARVSYRYNHSFIGTELTIRNHTLMAKSGGDSWGGMFKNSQSETESDRPSTGRNRARNRRKVKRRIRDLRVGAAGTRPAVNPKPRTS